MAEVTTGPDAGDEDGACAGVPSGAGPTRMSLPRPLMPLLEFLYISEKYSQSSLSLSETMSPGRRELNLAINVRSSWQWNLFW